ncbi:MAG: LysR family transcriptional regulator [Methyloligellaceae bacterium]
MDRMRALEVFLEVADSGSLAAAARSLSISAPSVTRILGEYEEELGVLLFHRTTRALTLTDDGKNFLNDARHIIDAYKDASDALRGAHRSPQGTLRITASTLFGQHYILPLLMEYMDEYPEVKVDAVFLDRVVSLIDEGFDLAVRIGHLPDSSMIATRVGSVRRVICGCETYFEKYGMPEKPSDLKDHNIILGMPVSSTLDWRFSGKTVVRLKPRLRLSSISAAIAAAKSGWGITRVLSYQIGPELGDGGLKTVLSEYEPEPLPIHIIHPEGRSASAKVRAFVDLARDTIRKNPYLNR